MSNSAALLPTVESSWQVVRSVGQTVSIVKSPYSEHIRSVHLFIAKALRFSHILLFTNFYLVYITTRNIFLIPDDTVARNLIIIFNFSSQGPHLSYIVFFNVYIFRIQWSSDPKIIGIKTDLFENFSQKKRLPKILGDLFRVKIR